MSKKKQPLELFIKSDNQAKNINKNSNIITESITSIENLSDTSESEQSQYIINTISTQLKQKINDIE
tara:strand:+ start:214 stop:414 length:201 start_codon:yes stop_codon:yes gene_type:complete